MLGSCVSCVGQRRWASVGVGAVLGAVWGVVWVARRLAARLHRQLPPCSRAANHTLRYIR